MADTAMASVSSEAFKAAYTSFFISAELLIPRRIDDEMPSYLWIDQDVLQHAHADGLLHNVNRDLHVLFKFASPPPYAVPHANCSTNDVLWLRDPM